MYGRVAGQWARLAARLGERRCRRSRTRCASCSSSRSTRRLRAIFADGLVGAVARRDGTAAQLDKLERRFVAFLAAVAAATGVTGDPAVAAAIRARGRGDRAGIRGGGRKRGRTGRRGEARATARTGHDEPDRCVARTQHHPAGSPRRVAATLLAGWRSADRGTGTRRRRGRDEPGLVRRAPPAGRPRAGLREAGLDEGEAWTVADQVRVLLSLPRPSGLRGPARTADARLLDRWLASDIVRTAIGLNTWEGVEWLDRDRFETSSNGRRRLDAIEAGPAVGAPAGPDAEARLAAAAEAAGLPPRCAARRAAAAPCRPGSPALSPAFVE